MLCHPPLPVDFCHIFHVCVSLGMRIWHYTTVLLSWRKVLFLFFVRMVFMLAGVRWRNLALGGSCEAFCCCGDTAAPGRPRSDRPAEPELLPGGGREGLGRMWRKQSCFWRSHMEEEEKEELVPDLREMLKLDPTFWLHRNQLLTLPEASKSPFGQQVELKGEKPSTDQCFTWQTSVKIWPGVYSAFMTALRP